MHKSTTSNPSGFRFFSPSPSHSSTITASVTSPSGAATPGGVTTPDDTHNHQASYFLRSNSSKKPSRPPLNHQKSLDSVTMFGRVGGREYMNVTPVPPLTQTPQSPNAQYEQVHELATKRMATLDYLRRAHEGRVYWFNTVLFSRNDLNRGLYGDTKKLAKRATNYFVLGCSIPNILDLGVSSPIDYLKAFHQLLTEYETYQSHNHEHHHGNTHSSGGSVAGLRLTSSSVRIPKLFSRSKPRRGSTATTAPSLVSSSAMSGITSSSQDSSDSLLERTRSMSGSTINLPSISQQSLSSDSSDPPPVPPLPANPPPPVQYGMSISGPLPMISHSSTTTAAFGTPGAAQGESDYLYLTIPPLPFDPDFYETFATLCDVLIDAYSRVLTLVSTPQQCSVGVGEMFIKADAKIRKCVVGAVVREFEEASRGPLGVKGEVGGIGKLVLGGII